MALIMVLEDELRKAVEAVNRFDGITPADLDYLTYSTAGLLLQELGIIVGAAMGLDPEEDSNPSTTGVN